MIGHSTARPAGARLLLTVAAAATLAACLESSAAKPAAGSTDLAGLRQRVPVAADDPRLGAADAPITMVMFVDFACAYSRDAFDRARDAVATSGGEVALVVKQLPLPGHLLAPMAARAALAADRQGQFEAMARALFVAPDELDRPLLVARARALGLDVARFERDLDDAAVAAQVQRDIALARVLGVTVTPWWFVNGVSFKGKLDGQRVADLIAAERGNIAALLDDGVARGAVYSHIMAGAARLRVAAPDAPAALDPDHRYAVPVDDGDLIVGPAAAPVTAVLFADVECPHTRKMWRALGRARARHGDALRVVIKHDPLPRHRLAVEAHLALAAATRVGHGEALLERLMGGDGLSGRDELFVEARRVGLVPVQLEREMAAPSTAMRVRDHRHLAARFGVRGTPTTFVNGRPVAGVVHPDHLADLVADELAAATALPAGAGAIYDRVLAGADVDAAPVRPAGPAIDLAARLDVPVAADDPVRGVITAPVTVIAYMDFECPHSAAAAAALERLRARHGDRVRTVFKHLPLAMHDHARNAAAAALAAQRQGRFWAMHDWLFAHQATLDRASIEAALATLGIEPTRFARDFDDAAVTDRPIIAAEADGKARGFTGTPTLVINGHVLPGLVDDALLDELIAAEVAH